MRQAQIFHFWIHEPVSQLRVKFVNASEPNNLEVILGGISRYHHNVRRSESEICKTLNSERKNNLWPILQQVHIEWKALLQQSNFYIDLRPENQHPKDKVHHIRNLTHCKVLQ